MTTSPAIVIDDLHKRYGDRDVVDGVCLTIEPGETFALLGPNGAGKSTTIEILEGYRNRTSGSVRVLGEDPQTAGRSWRADIGIVLQDLPDSEVYSSYTVREQLAQQARYYPRSRDISEVIDAVGLSAKADARIGTLSGGQRRRVDVALGIIGDPKLLFLDEPTTGFDPEARRDFWDLISSLSGAGTTIILTTHYLEEAAYLADRVGVIINGHLLACGPVDTLGGPQSQTPIVSWRDETGARRSERTTTPGAVVASLMRDGEPRDLQVRRPSLEDVYLGLLETNASGSQTSAGSTAA